MFPAYSGEAQAPWVYCYALILLVTLAGSEIVSHFLTDTGPVRSGVVWCGPVSPGAVNTLHLTTYGSSYL